MSAQRDEIYSEVAFFCNWKNKVYNLYKYTVNQKSRMSTLYGFLKKPIFVQEKQLERKIFLEFALCS